MVTPSEAKVKASDARAAAIATGAPAETRRQRLRTVRAFFERIIEWD